MLANGLKPTEPIKQSSKTINSVLDFTLQTKPDYKINWHHRVLCDYLDRFVTGEIKRLMVFMPPRHGKSELVSRRLPAYILGKYPEASIIATSYSADLASRMNRDVQRIIDEPSYRKSFPDTALFGSNVRTVARGSYLRNSDIFEVVGHKGVYRSAGVGGGITGMGYNYGIIDDPIKNSKDANSPTYRNSVWEWYTSTFYTRQEDNAGILITLTRWHIDDLAGRLLRAMQTNDEFADQWTIVNFPALATPSLNEDDPREIDEALWPGKYDYHTLRKFQSTLTSREWEALYQQNPIPAEGGLFKTIWFEPWIDRCPEIVHEVRYWDLAMSAKTTADYTVGVKISECVDGHWYVTDVVRKRVEWGDLTNFIAKVILNDGNSVMQGIEKKGYMSRAIQELNQDGRLRDYSIFGYDVDTDKYTRALPFAAKCGAKLIHLLNRHWTQSYVEELCTFTGDGDMHDDQVDASAGAWAMIGQSSSFEGSMNLASYNTFDGAY